ncbi:hypothetical protein H6G27_36485 [Nostoc linckia FACHB-104]|nr:hypothetical protein [Nostoc linckia FACHB-104]
MLENYSFAFVSNILDIKCKLPFKINENFYFKKAEFDQITKIKTFLESAHFLNYSPYEFMYIEESNTSSEKILNIQKLEPKDWQYYILCFKEDEKFYDLQLVANLAKLELEFAIQFFYIEETQNYDIGRKPTAIFNYFTEMKRKVSYLPTTIDDTHLQDLSKIYEDFVNLDKTNYPFRVRASQLGLTQAIRRT